jgi:hypothetical protein
MSARGSIAITENFGDLLDARVRKIFAREYGENIKESMIPYLYGMETTTRNYEILSGMGAMSDLADFDGQVTYDTISQLYDKTTYFPEKCLGMKVERKLVDDDMFKQLDRRPWQMAVSTARTREKSGAAIFNNAFTGSGGGDGQPLCSSSHPYSPDDASTLDNAGTSAMSATAIEATRRLAHTDILTDRGDLANVSYDTILCTVSNEETAWEIIESKGKVETADNNRNFHEGRYKLAVWDRLTDSNNWFMLDSKLCKMFLIWWDRIKPEFNYDRDFETYQAKWSVYTRYNVDFYDWRPVYGHLV